MTQILIDIAVSLVVLVGAGMLILCTIHPLLPKLPEEE